MRHNNCVGHYKKESLCSERKRLQIAQIVKNLIAQQNPALTQQKIVVQDQQKRAQILQQSLVKAERKNVASLVHQPQKTANN